uniref:Uncharacterized protein n=1 Tax=Arundo donax TaxID=35708 RepID=A0A0A9E9V3_ARUDO
MVANVLKKGSFVIGEMEEELILIEIGVLIGERKKRTMTHMRRILVLLLLANLRLR